MKFDTPPPPQHTTRIMLFLPPTPSLQVSSFRLAIRGHNWGAGGARGSWTSVAGIHCFTAWINSYQTQINVFFRKTPPKNISCHFLEWINWKCFRVNWMHWHVRIVEILVSKGHLICDHVAENKLWFMIQTGFVFFYVVSCLLAFPPKKFCN